MSTNLHIDDIGNLILRDGKLGLFVSSQYVTPPLYGGGRVGAFCPCEVEQINHYYAYGGIIGDLSSNEGLQEFKFGDKKLDRTYGLDLYDVEARQYDAITPWFTSIDPLAEKFTWLTPYNYCAGNSVNLVDPDGRAYYDVSKDGTITMRQDEHINDKTDFLFVKGNPKQEPLEITDRGILSGLINIKNSKKYDDGSRKIWTSTNSSEESLNVFTFLADNTEIEWSMSKFNNGQVAIGAILEKEHKGPIEGNAPNDFTEVQKTENEILHVHSHPCTPGPSGAYNDNWNAKPTVARYGDQEMYYQKFSNSFGGNKDKMSFQFIYHKGSYYGYNNLTRANAINNDSFKIFWTQWKR